MFLMTYCSTETERLLVVTLNYGTSCIQIFHGYWLPEAALLFGHLVLLTSHHIIYPSVGT